MLEAAVIAEDRVLCLQALVDGRGAQRTRRREFLVGEADAEAARVVLAHLGVGVGERGPIAVARHVHAPDVGARVAVHHPLREREAHAAALAEARHHAASDPEVAQAAHRADQRVAIRREGKGAVHDLFDARLAELREVLETHLEAGRDAVKVIRQQVLAEVPGGFLGRPRHAGFLVGADQHAAALLAQVDLSFEIDAVELLFLAREEGHVVGDEVLVFHGKDRQLDADHAADFARPQAAGIHHVFGVYGALFGDHIPCAVGALAQFRDAALSHDLGAADLSGLGIGVGDAVRVHMAFDRVVHGTGEMLLVHQRKKLLGLVDGDEFQFHAEVAAACLRHLQPVEALAGAGEHDAARDVHAAGLPRDLLDLAVEVDGVLLELGDVRVAVDGVHAAGRVPGRACGQLGAFDQHHVFPACFRQVVEHAHSHHTATDHYCLDVIAHDCLLFRKKKGRYTRHRAWGCCRGASISAAKLPWRRNCAGNGRA